MNYIEIEQWLLNTIPGIVILGAIGSIVGSILLWITVKGIKYITVFVFEKTTELIWKFLFNASVSYAREYFRARDLVNVLSSKSSPLPISLLYFKVQRKEFFYSILGALCFFISLLLFIFVGTEYTKTSIFFVAMTFLYAHDAVMYSIYLKIIENKFLKEDEEDIKQTHINRDDVFEEAEPIIDSWYENRKKHNKAIKKDS